VRRRNAPPLTPWILSWAGLIVFFAFPALAYWGPSPLNVVAPSGWFFYAAVILSFLGGVRWGFEMAVRPETPGVWVLTASIVPTIMAWGGVFLQIVNLPLALALLGAGFVLTLVWDGASTGASARRLPDWYGPLRATMTAGVLVSGGLIYALLTR
jgi:Protein of unknown function (DUF3429)